MSKTHSPSKATEREMAAFAGGLAHTIESASREISDDPALTLKELIHELSAGCTLDGKPVLVSGWDSTGAHVTFAVTGISVRTWRGGSVQSLRLRLLEGDREADELG